MQTDRDRLIELVDKAKREYAGDVTDHTETDYIVETLLNEGAILPPCKVGDTVWSFLEDNRLFECEVKQLYIDKKEIGMTYEPKAFRGRMYGVNIRAIGKTIFPTKEEAEEKLKELGK